MIRYRTVIIDSITKSKSSMSGNRYITDIHEMRIQIQSKLEEYDEMGYDLHTMQPIIGGVYSSSYTQAFVFVFKLRENV